MTSSASHSEILLHAEHLDFAYAGGRGAPVLRDVSFDIYKGEFLCLLGPSGCGKSTLLRLLSGLEQPNSGSITMVEGHAKRPKVGMVFQDLALFPHMSAARNIGYALRHLSRALRRARTDEMLKLVGLMDKRGAFPHELSGGQKQRLALARALAHQPDLILLDEPFTAQDAALRAQIRDDVIHILRNAAVAALLVTHDPEEAMHFADRIAVMNEGRIEQIGRPFDVYNAPDNAFVASFFGQVNTLKGRVENGEVATPLGRIAAPDFKDGISVDIVVRPEALGLSADTKEIDHRNPDHVHTHAFISERKYLGRSTLVHLDTHNPDDQGEAPLHFHARVPGRFVGDQKTVQDVFLDPSGVFLFKDEGA